MLPGWGLERKDLRYNHHACLILVLGRESMWLHQRGKPLHLPKRSGRKLPNHMTMLHAEFQVPQKICRGVPNSPSHGFLLTDVTSTKISHVQWSMPSLTRRSEGQNLACVIIVRHLTTMQIFVTSLHWTRRPALRFQIQILWWCRRSESSFFPKVGVWTPFYSTLKSAAEPTGEMTR